VSAEEDIAGGRDGAGHPALRCLPRRYEARAGAGGESPKAERKGDEAGGRGVSGEKDKGATGAAGWEKSLATRRKSREGKKQLIPEALLKYNGNINRACKACGISRRLYFAWRDEDPEFKQLTDDAEVWAPILDDLESLLIEIAYGRKKGNVAAACAVLNARAKPRGYGISRQEFTGPDGKAFTIKVVYEDQKTEPEHGS
jgi:hypothetical protein